MENDPRIPKAENLSNPDLCVVLALERPCHHSSRKRIDSLRFVFPALERLSRDRIPAVRVNVVRCYATIVANEYNLEESGRNLANEKLRSLARDSDFDVRRTACRSIDGG